jgi:hypothetical protein
MEVAPRCHPHAPVVQIGAAAAFGGKELVGDGIVDDACNQLIGFEQGD